MTSATRLPSGTVTLLFTDIEGSTRLLRTLGHMYAAVQADHQRLLRDAFAAHGGHEIDTQGDSFYVAFRRSRDAVAAACAGQRALAEHEWPAGVAVAVRMGIHTGEPAIGGDRYIGFGVHRGARIAAAGHGGQVLLSSATRDLVEDDLPSGVSLRDLGLYRLKDIDRPERLSELVVDELTTSFPQLRAERTTSEFAAFARRSVSLVALSLITGLAVTVAVLMTTARSAAVSTLAPDSVGVIDAASLRVTAQLPLPGSPTRLATAPGGSVWVGADQAGTLSALDPGTRKVGRVVATSGFPTDLAVGEAAVWVIDGRSGLLTKIDPSYGSLETRTRVAPSNFTAYDRTRQSLDPTAVAVGVGSIWTIDGSVRLTRVNPTTLKKSRIDLGSPLDDVTVGDGAIWAISGSTASVFRLNRNGQTTLRMSVASRPGAESPYPIAIAVGGGFAWVLDANTATVTKIDPAQRLVAATIQLGVQRRPARLAFGDGAAWVADGDGTLARIDATSDRPQFLPVAPALRDVVVVGKTVWVTAAAGGAGRTSIAASSGRVQPLPTSFCSPVYSGSGTRPHALIVGDLGLQGPGGDSAAQAGEAVQLILKQHRFRAGRFVLGYQSCDNSSASRGATASPPHCAANAGAYADDAAVLGVIAAGASFCSQVQLPIMNRAPAGPLAMVALDNTYVGLTHHGPGTAAAEPAKYYPTGVRSYVRVSAADDVQGAADALVAHRLGARKVFVLRDGEPYGDGIAADFAAAAKHIGLRLAGPITWNYQATSYLPFISQVVRTHADAVFLGAFLVPQTALLIKELRAALPRTVHLICPDGFAPAALVASVGAAAEGMTVSAPGWPAERLPSRGRRFVADFERATGSPTPPSPLTIAAAQATEVLLAAIARSDGTRASVVEQLFRTRITDGLLGSSRFDHNGDTTAGAITIYRITHGSPTILTVITPRHLGGDE